jgi:hypothetical protein
MDAYGCEMSVDIFVFMREQDLPSTRRWQAALDRLEVGIHLDATPEPTTHSGYWPVTASAQASGFEYLAGPIADAFGSQPPVEVQDRDFVVDLITHSDMQELRCAMFAACALAPECNGVIVDGESGTVMTTAEMRAQASSID